MARHVVHQLLATDAALDKLGARGVWAAEVEQLPPNRHLTIPNPRAGREPGTRVLLIGETKGGRGLTLVIERTVEPTTWLKATGWACWASRSPPPSAAPPSPPRCLSAPARRRAPSARCSRPRLSLLTTTFTEGRERAKAFGIYAAIAGGGSAVGLLLGGVQTEYLSWRWSMYVNLALAIPAAAGLVMLVNQRAAVRNRIDVPGALTATTGLFAIVYGVSNAETSSWTNATTLGFLAAGVALLGAFVLVERRCAHPLLPLRIVLDRDRAASFLGVGLASMGVFGACLFLTYYLQQTLDYSPVTTGLAFMPMSVGVILAAVMGSSYLLPHLGRRLMVSLGMVLAASGMVLLTQIGLDSEYVTHVAPGLTLMGVGVGMVFAAAFSGATVGVTDDDSGVASATVNTFQQIGGSIGTALLSTMFATAVENGIADHGPGAIAAQLAALDGYTTVFWWSAAIFGAGALATGLLYRPGKRQLHDCQSHVALEGSPVRPATRFLSGI